MYQAHPTRLAPHQPAQSPSQTHCCACWWALTPPFHPSPCRPEAGYRLVCSLLPSCVTGRLLHRCPTLRFQWVACSFPREGARSREVPQEALSAPCDGSLARHPAEEEKVLLPLLHLNYSNSPFFRQGSVTWCHHGLNSRPTSTRSFDSYHNLWYTLACDSLVANEENQRRRTVSHASFK